MTPIKILGGLFAVVILMLAYVSAFTVNEGEAALVLRLGQIVSDADAKTPVVYAPGLHFRIPFVDHVRVFDTRLQELATSSTQPLVVVTKEQTYLVIDYFARWRISNLPRFYTSTGGSVSWAETLLEQRINDIVRAEYGKYSSAQAISTDRANMVNAIREEASHIGKDQGIFVLDVRVQQITLPKDVMDSVFKRMATERKQFAEAKRAEGIEKSEEIRALADQKVTIIKAQALMQAAQTRASGDKAAADIYSKAYSQDPRFYSFYRSLEAYTNSFYHGDVLVLKPDGQFFNYFKNASGNGTVSSRK